MMSIGAFLTRVFIAVENLERKRTVRALRAAGQRIADDVSFGRRVQIDIDETARVDIGPGTKILQDSWLIAEAHDTLRIGESVFIGQHCTVSGSVEIGDSTLIASFVSIIDAQHVMDDPTVPIARQGGRKNPILIGRDVWIGASSIVLGGVTIGDHAVVGANSTVTRDVPPWAIVAGSPASIIRMREQS